MIIAVARKLVYQIYYTLKHNWYFTNTENAEKEIRVFKLDDITMR